MNVSEEQINDLRKRVLNKEPVSREELAAAIRQKCAERLAQASAAPKTKAPKKLDTSALDDLL